MYVASETTLVRRHVADLVRAQGGEADYFMVATAAHPVSDKAANFGRHVPPASIRDAAARADALFPYLEWWALAHSRAIEVHRSESLSPGASTYSGTAHIYGGRA